MISREVSQMTSNIPIPIHIPYIFPLLYLQQLSMVPCACDATSLNANQLCQRMHKVHTSTTCYFLLGWCINAVKSSMKQTSDLVFPTILINVKIRAQAALHSQSHPVPLQLCVGHPLWPYKHWLQYQEWVLLKIVLTLLPMGGGVMESPPIAIFF